MSSESRLTKLGDLVDIKHGFAFKGEFFSDLETNFQLTTPGNFAIGGGFQLGKGKFYNGPVPNDYVLKVGDLLVTMTDLSKAADTLGYAAKVPESPGVTWLHNQRVGLVTVKSDVAASADFIHFLMRGPDYRHWVVSTATGSTVKHTSPSRICDYEFMLPPLDSQQEVANFLDALDDRITLLRETNATLEAIAQALFKSWFVDFDPVRAKMEGLVPEGMDEATAALFPDSFEESELGEVPRGWSFATIGELANIIDCLHSKKPVLLEEGWPFLQLNNIRDDGLLDTSTLACISQLDYKKWVSRIEASGGDCIITNVGRVGAVAQIPEEFTAAMGRNMTAIRLRPAWPYPTYLIELLQSPWMRAEIDSNTDQGTILNALNVKSIPRLRCPLAPHAVLECFENKVRPLRAAMEGNLRQTHTLSELRDGLLPRLISGQLSLREGHDKFFGAIA